MSWLIWGAIILVSPLIIYILVRVFSSAVFESYFESKLKHSIFKGDAIHGEKEDKEK